MNPLAIVGWSAVAVLVIGWLIVSFSAPSPRRALIEWISACAMYLALLMLFTNLALQMYGDGNTVGLVAFLFLCTLFGGGLLVCIYHAATSMRSGKATTSATS